MPWLTIKRNSGSPAGFTPDAGVVLFAEDAAFDVPVSLALLVPAFPLLSGLLSDAMANGGRSATVKTPAQSRVEMRIMD
jgi:hypothetical protein